MSYSRQEENGKDTLHFLEPSPSTSTSSIPSNQSAAYDPETGEFNWDCPCLGGMAQGPCGDTFKEAFSCFVLSEAETKGSDCLGKFTAMNDCFRANGYYDGEDEEEDDVETN
ncbi:Oxidoreductase [Mortierella hygrophila]|uniref:Mitochondrial intermembrane space import and assembly protein 40 n=1 Tax=Mortierella hygrophila TaxID=979708 RepID=A0A9P6F6U8_9FUNG|nr:Oxidoreductase [Mortierella hygrophila]